MTSPYEPTSVNSYERVAEPCVRISSNARSRLDTAQLLQNNYAWRSVGRRQSLFDLHEAKRQNYIEDVIASVLSQPKQPIHSAPFWVRWQEINDLEKGWDGRNSKPVSKLVLLRALLLTSSLISVPHYVEPQLSPLYDGGLQLNWRCNNRTLEAELGHGESIGLLGTHRANGQAEYYEADVAYGSLEEFANYLAWLHDEAVAWPTR